MNADSYSHRSNVKDITLIGDSIFDNRAYTNRDPDNGNFDKETDRLTRIALMKYNDAILRVAFERRLPVIDLRFVCSEPSDYANPIEPSGSGGRKIAEAIARACGALEGGPTSRVFVD